MPTGRSGWFRVREDLHPRRRAVLTALSFLAPLATWCLVSYVPFLWHPDVKLTVSAEQRGVSTVFIAGDHVSKGYFPGFSDAIRKENALVEAGGMATEPPRVVRRNNQKILRQMAPVGISNGWLDAGQREDDALISGLWRDLATGAKVPERLALSAENMEIVRKNHAMLAAAAPEFEPSSLPDKPLLKLVPQGVPANPVYLPAPHEVLITGWTDFTTPPANGMPTMGSRIAHSVRIIFLGFLFSCIVGVPLGILCGTFDFFSRLFEPFIDFFRYLPAPTFSTLLVAVFLAADEPKIALVFVGTFFQMVLVVSKTTRLLDKSLIEAAQTLGAKPRQLVTRVVVPGILPDLYNDMRILLGWSWTWLVIAELIGVKSGLTEFIETQGRFRNFDRVFPVIILIGMLGFVTDQLLAYFRGVLFPWTSDSGPGKRRVARVLGWMPATIAAAARERAGSMATPVRREPPTEP